MIPIPRIGDLDGSNVVEFWLEFFDGYVNVMGRSPLDPRVVITICEISREGLTVMTGVDLPGIPVDNEERIKVVYEE